MPASQRLPHPSRTVRRSVIAAAFVAIAALMVGAVATAAPPKPPKPVKTDLSNRTFISETVSGNNPLPGGGPITMSFGPTNSVSINAGCNRMRSTVSLAKGHFTVKQPMASTMKLCPGLALGADQWMVWFLKRNPVWRLDGANLVLSTGDVRVRLVDRVEAADRPLLRTKWTVTAFVSRGAVVTSEALEKTRPVLRFSDFQVSGYTGCNTFNGPAVPVTSMIVFGPMMNSGRPCSPSKRQVEQKVLNSLYSLQNYEVDGKKLTITSASGDGLVARTDR